MRGKRLFNLLSELNKTEHRQLLNQCKISSDKRSQDLYELLQKRVLNEAVFEKHLVQISLEFKKDSNYDTEKLISRWIDFACKEVENLFLKNKLQNKEYRDEVLSKIFNERENKELSLYYNGFVVAHCEKEKQYGKLIKHYTIEYNWLVRDQTKKNYKKLIKWALLKKDAIEKFNLEAHTASLISLSSIFIDEPSSFPNELLSEYIADINYYFSKVNDPYLKGLLLNAECRLSFYDRELFQENLIKLQSFINSLDNSMPKKFSIQRYYHFIYCLGGIYHGLSLDHIQTNARITFDLILNNIKHNDTISMFFLLFTTLLKREFLQFDELVKQYEKKCFQFENEYYLFFLYGLKSYLNKDYKAAISYLLNITYSDNKYVAIWSKLLEIRIHLDLNNNNLANLLKARTLRFLKLNQSQKFYYDQSLKCLELIFAPNEEKQKNSLFEFYKLIIQGNKL